MKNKNKQNTSNFLAAINSLRNELKKVGVKMIIDDSEKDVKFVDSDPFDFNAVFLQAKTPADIREISVTILADAIRGTSMIVPSASSVKLASFATVEHLLYILALFVASELPMEFRTVDTIIDYLQNIIDSSDFQNSETGSAIKGFAEEKPFPYILVIYQDFITENIIVQKRIASFCKLALTQHNEYVMKKKLMIAITKAALKKYYENERKLQETKSKTKQKKAERNQEKLKRQKVMREKKQDNTKEDAAYVAFCAKGAIFAFAVDLFLLLGFLLSNALTLFNISLCSDFSFSFCGFWWGL